MANPGTKNSLDRQGRVVVIESLTQDKETWQLMTDLAAEFGWRLLDLKFSNGWFPTDPAPIAAIVSHPSPSPIIDQLIPVGCPIVRYGFAPHPDDETWGCGGTVAKKISEGYEVLIMVLTDGRYAFQKMLGIESKTTA